MKAIRPLQTVAIVEGMKIQFYFDDRPPSHFHAILAERRVSLGIETLQVRTGSLPKAKLDQSLPRQGAGARLCGRRGVLVRKFGIPGRSDE